MAPGVTLTGVGAVLIMIVATGLGAVIDNLVGPALGTATAIMLSIGVLVAVWLVRRGNLSPVVLAPPLVYTLVAVVSLLLTSAYGLTAAGLATALVYGFPAMAVATGLGVLVALARRLAGR